MPAGDLTGVEGLGNQESSRSRGPHELEGPGFVRKRLRIVAADFHESNRLSVFEKQESQPWSGTWRPLVDGERVEHTDDLIPGVQELGPHL
jgi:hypothetical protein